MVVASEKKYIRIIHCIVYMLRVCNNRRTRNNAETNQAGKMLANIQRALTKKKKTVRHCSTELGFNRITPVCEYVVSTKYHNGTRKGAVQGIVRGPRDVEFFN